MAKVRIQTRSADTENAGTHGLPAPVNAHHKHSGAVDILIRVWRQQGFAGLYQVRSSNSLSHLITDMPLNHRV
jgi:hypothetical protein